MGVNRGDIASLMKGMAPVISDYIHGQLQPVADRLIALEAEVAGLRVESKKLVARGVIYRGVYASADEYKRGDLVTFDGSMWHANEETRERPGKSSAWTLAVKRGRDAKP
jgi:hypothetical protein